MRKAYLIPMALTALLVGSTMASAQCFRDDPPGWAYQKQRLIEDNGGNPFDYCDGRRYSSRGAWRGAYAWQQPVWPQPYRYRNHNHHRHRNWR